MFSGGKRVCPLMKRDHLPEAATDKVRLFCIPFAGGSRYAYRGLGKYTADFIHLVHIELPGHGQRMREPLLTDARKIAEDIFLQIRDDLNPPYAFYGHSLGALLSYLLARKIMAENMPDPVRLFVSGRQGPSVAEEDKDTHRLPRRAFYKKVAEYGGTPQKVLEEEELMAFMEPILRADFQAVATYRHSNTIRLHTPITVMIGLEEKVKHEDALKWREVTHGEISLKQFPGGHFFIFDHFPEIGRIVSTELEKTFRHRPVRYDDRDDTRI
jgi:surfactin synthase thioesterase subunit